MRNSRCLTATVGIALGLSAAFVSGQDIAITSIDTNGQLSWTNNVISNALYRVEWASQAGGPWHRTFDNIGSIDGNGASDFVVGVPMFYRVVMTTNQAPWGMVWVEGGDVSLGQAGFAEPVHTAYVGGFWMDAMEMTKAKWNEVAGWAGSNGYDISEGSVLCKTNNHPIYQATWYVCVKWCNARSQKEGLTPCYYLDAAYAQVYKTNNIDISPAWVNWLANGYRLPTEAEWEKAARGGRQGRLFPWGGDTVQHSEANYHSLELYSYDTSPTRGSHPIYGNGDYPRTSPAGSFRANGYGLYDMAGNVWEWCWDWHGDYSSPYQINPTGPSTGSNRVVRGGCWDGGAPTLRCAWHVGSFPWDTPATFGFRCVRTP